MEQQQIQIDMDVLKSELGQYGLERLMARSQVKLAADALETQQARIAELEAAAEPKDGAVKAAEKIVKNGTPA